MSTFIKPTVVITRHQSFLDYLSELGMIDGEIRVIRGRATVEDIRNQHVLGTLPFHLAKRALSVTEIPLRLSQEDRDALQKRRGLSLERLREIAGDPVTYVVTEVETPF